MTDTPTPAYVPDVEGLAQWLRDEAPRQYPSMPTVLLRWADAVEALAAPRVDVDELMAMVHQFGRDLIDHKLLQVDDVRKAEARIRECATRLAEPAPQAPRMLTDEELSAVIYEGANSHEIYIAKQAILAYEAVNAGKTIPPSSTKEATS